MTRMRKQKQIAELGNLAFDLYRRLPKQDDPVWSDFDRWAFGCKEITKANLDAYDLDWFVSDGELHLTVTLASPRTYGDFQPEGIVFIKSNFTFTPGEPPGKTLEHIMSKCDEMRDRLNFFAKAEYREHVQKGETK